MDFGRDYEWVIVGGHDTGFLFAGEPYVPRIPFLPLLHRRRLYREALQVLLNVFHMGSVLGTSGTEKGRSSADGEDFLSVPLKGLANILGELLISVQLFSNISQGLALLGIMSTGLMVSTVFTGVDPVASIWWLLPLLREELGVFLVNVLHWLVEYGTNR